MEKINRRQWMTKATLLGGSLMTIPYILKSAPADGIDRIIKLNANENPYGPSRKALVAIQEVLSEGNRYAFEKADNLITSIASHHAIKSNNLMLGAGSSQLLHLLGNWILNKAYTITYASPTFKILPNYVKNLGGGTKKIATKQFYHDLDAMLESSLVKPGVVYVVNPNNPTGTKLNRDELVKFCLEASRHSYVIVDEAYIEYVEGNESLINLIHENKRIIVLRTFSKIYGLAGLRVGYLAAHNETINQLKNYQIWSHDSLSVTGITAASKSLNDNGFVKTSRDYNNQTRQFMVDELAQFGIRPITSHTNFIFYEDPSGEEVQNYLRERNILIGRLQVDDRTYLRVSLGTRNEMDQFLSRLKEFKN